MSFVASVVYCAARVVLTHSTYVPGLEAACRHLATALTSVSTITPGRITRCRSGVEHLLFRVTVAVPGGYKVLAQKGTSLQEVFFTTSLTAEGLQQSVNDALTHARKNKLL
jgi:hypothetical protein